MESLDRLQFQIQTKLREKKRIYIALFSPSKMLRHQILLFTSEVENDIMENLEMEKASPF
jgi:hypothetical protein